MLGGSSTLLQSGKGGSPPGLLWHCFFYTYIIRQRTSTIIVDFIVNFSMELLPDWRIIYTVSSYFSHLLLYCLVCALCGQSCIKYSIIFFLHSFRLFIEPVLNFGQRKEKKSLFRVRNCWVIFNYFYILVYLSNEPFFVKQDPLLALRKILSASYVPKVPT